MTYFFTAETNKKIRKWLKASNFKVGFRFGKCIAYEAEDKAITVEREYDATVDEFFVEFLTKNGLTSNCDVVALSILHEIGHFETEHLFTTDEWDMDFLIKETLEQKARDNKYEGDVRAYLFEYWRTKTEYAANVWAIMYANTFPEKVEELTKILYERV